MTSDATKSPHFSTIILNKNTASSRAPHNFSQKYHSSHTVTKLKRVSSETSFIHCFVFTQDSNKNDI